MSSKDDDTDSADERSLDVEKSDGESTPGVGLLEAKQTVLESVGDLIEHPLEGVIKVNRTTERDWRVVLEVVEREAIPDTQDMIGRYEFTVTASGVLDGYSLVERYHRGDTKDEL